jgi:ribosomal protein S6--L-glutamate ligase
MNITILSRCKEAYFNRRITEESSKIGFTTETINPFKIITDGINIFFEDRILNPDLIFLRTPPWREEKDFIHIIGDVMTNREVNVVNSPMSAELCGNKVLTKIRLESQGVPVLKWSAVRDTENLDKAAETAGGYPLFMKTIFGTRGIGVIFCPCRETLIASAQTLWAYHANIFVEEFARESHGKTVRILVSNNQIIGGVANIADAASLTLRSNFSRGGETEPFEPDCNMKEIALKACSALRTKLAGVDLIKSSKGWAVLEVNSSPGIKGFEKAAGINAAEAILKSFLS